jgi:D,D-heptose 1,7-bisphosphate phosphatase
MSNKVAILAGGMGTRLKSRTGNIPKPMALLNGKPVLEYQILLCKKYYLIEIALLVHYEHECISSYFGDGSKWGVSITYIIEENPRGTAGALYDSLKYMDDEFFVFYGDTFLDVDLSMFINFHNKNKSKASILVHPNDHPNDSDLVEINSMNQVVKMHSYPHDEGKYLSNLVNAALYIFEKKFISKFIPFEGKYDLAKNTFPTILEENQIIYAFRTQEYIKDMGTPDRLDKVELDILKGLPEKLSLRQSRSTIFLDRDGTINVEVNHLKKLEDFVLLNDVAESIRKINQNGLLTVCITNQPVVARGELTLEDLSNIHKKMDYELGLKGAYLDMLYYCPHHPESGFAGEIKDFKIDCDCRKPKTGLIDRAVNELNIDRTTSWFIGDTTSDIKAGKSSGLKTILLRTGHAGYDAKYDVEPDFIFPNLSNAVDFILSGYSKLMNNLFPISKSLSESRLVLVGGPARSGKSTISQVICQLLKLSGRNVHVISLDGWLFPLKNRVEGEGVLKRYNLPAILDLFIPILESTERHQITIPIYDRLLREPIKNKSISIGPNDIIILEGVIALMDDSLCSKANQCIFMDVENSERDNRLLLDYTWRKSDLNILQNTLESRKNEELLEVYKSSKNSTYKITT